MENNSMLYGRTVQNYECLLGTLPGVVYTLDEEGNFTYVSESAGTMLGFSRDELVGRHFSCIVHPGDLPSVSREFLLPRFSGVPTGSDRAPKLFDERRSWPRRTNSLQVRLCKKETKNSATRSVVKCKVNASGQYDESNSFSGTVGIIYDPVDDDSKAFPLDVKKNYNAYELLTHAISHVFSNVFTGIYGNLQLIEMQIENPQEYAGNFEAIKHTIENAVSLIKRLSQTVSIQEKRSSGHLDKLLNEEADGLLKVPGLDYRCDVGHDLWKPEVDPDYTRHIIRAIYYHIARSVIHDSFVEIKAANISESHVKLPRIDCAYIHIGFKYFSMSDALSTDAIEQFSALERIASMALSYELLKKAGGHIVLNNSADRCIVDLYLPAASPAA